MSRAKNIFLATICVFAGGAGIGIVVVENAFPPESLSEKKCVHVSIDDCWISLSRLSSPQVKSIYDVPFFANLRKWHESYGAKFTCYVYGGVGGNAPFSLKDVPAKFRGEFADASDWLKFGFHATCNDIEKTKAQSADEFAENFARINSEIDRFAGTCSRAKTLRLDYFFAKENWLQVIFSAGTQNLLGPDSAGRKAYSLDKTQSRQLWELSLIHISEPTRPY